MLTAKSSGKSARGEPNAGATDQSQAADGQSQQYARFLEQRIQEGMEENKRYLSKYADLRAFAYNQIESLVRKQAQAKSSRYSRAGGGGALSSTSINANSLNVYKQMMEKERKQWQEERSRKDAYIAEVQATVLKQSNEMGFMKKQTDDLESDI